MAANEHHNFECLLFCLAITNESAIYINAIVLNCKFKGYIWVIFIGFFSWILKKYTNEYNKKRFIFEHFLHLYNKIHSNAYKRLKLY